MRLPCRLGVFEQVRRTAAGSLLVYFGQGGQHSSCSHHIARRNGQFEVLVDTLMPRYTVWRMRPADLPQPEVLLDALTDRLADCVARMACGSPVDRTGADARVIARNMPGHMRLTAASMRSCVS